MTETQEAVKTIVLLVGIIIVVRFIYLILAIVIFKRPLTKDDIGFLVAVIFIPAIIYSLIKFLLKKRDKDETL